MPTDFVLEGDFLYAFCKRDKFQIQIRGMLVLYLVNFAEFIFQFFLKINYLSLV